MMKQLVSLVLVLGLAVWVPGAVLAVNVLVSNAYSLGTGQYLSVSDQYYLVMQPDCKLVLYNQSGQPIRSTNATRPTSPPPYCSLSLEADGNLVIYAREWTSVNGDSLLLRIVSIWEQGFVSSNEGNHSFLLLGSDGSLDFYDNSGKRRDSTNGLRAEYINTTSIQPAYFLQSTAWRPTVSLEDFPHMPAEYFLAEGKRLLTENSRFEFVLGSDCNLQSREIQLGSVVWESGTSSLNWNHECQLILQQDGLLVLRDWNASTVYWSSGLQDRNGSVSWILKVDPENGSLSVRDITNSSKILWTTVQLEPEPKPKRRILGIVLGVVGGLCVLALATFGLYAYARKRFVDPNEKTLFQVGGSKSKALTQAQIKLATNNYEKLIGRGGFGDVFYGQLPDGQEVAAKVLSASSHQSKQEFFNEIELLSKVHHTSLVSLVGYTYTHKHQILIYEYMAGGNLQHRLQGESGAKNPLTWKQRTNIILQVAEGLEYLHDKCSPPIIHRDIKSTNILLTNKLVAKVADFGLSKPKIIGKEDATHITTVVKGTPGYLDPEYYETGQLTEE